MLVTLPPYFAQGNQPLWNESIVSELNLIYIYREVWVRAVTGSLHFVVGQDRYFHSASVYLSDCFGKWSRTLDKITNWIFESDTS